jgi:hypothetical protein
MKRKIFTFQQVLKITGVRLRETSYCKRFPKKLLLKSQKRPGSGSGSEMEFWDISLTKDSSILLHAIHSPFTGGF